MAASDPTPYVATPTGTLQGVAAFSWDGSAWQPSGRAGPDVATPTGVLQGIAPFSWDGASWQPSGRAQPGVAALGGVLDGVAVYTWSGSAWVPPYGGPSCSTPTGALRGVAAFSWDGAAWQPASQARPSVPTPYGVLDGVAFFNWSGTTWAAGSATVPAGATLDLSFLSGALDPRITFTRASTATYIDATGTMQTAASGAPRFDYDPVTHALRGLLIEEARTNLWLFSADASNANWQAAGTVVPVVTANQITAPDGTLTAARVAIPSNGNTAMRQLLTVTAAVYSFSIYLRGSVGGEQTYLFVQTGAASYSSVLVTLTTGWQRFTITPPALTAAGWYFSIGVDTRDATQTIKPAATIYMWGAQVEQGAFPTSYIPTTAAAVTRAMDVATIPSTGWFVSPGGSWAAEFVSINPLVAASYRRIVTVDVAASVGIITLDNTASLLGQYDGAAAMFTANAVTVGAVAKGATTWTSGSAKACLNGGAVVSSAALTGGYSGVLVNNVRFLSNATPAEGMSGYMRRVRYWPRVLSNAEMQSVTT